MEKNYILELYRDNKFFARVINQEARSSHKIFYPEDLIDIEFDPNFSNELKKHIDFENYFSLAKQYHHKLFVFIFAPTLKGKLTDEVATLFEDGYLSGSKLLQVNTDVEMSIIQTQIFTDFCFEEKNQLAKESSIGL